MLMNGIVNIIKPPGMTSFDVVAYLRKVLKTRKIGHTGTLDPDAAGVLPICVGNATKAIEYITNKDKLYRAELTLGVETDTQDSSGKILREVHVNCSTQQIHEVIQSFVGKIQQVPPMFSAVKVDGQKLYELARKGMTIKREAREIVIYSLDIIQIREENEGTVRRCKVLFDIACSKGTYIRTLCADIGERLGCGGHMSFLVRCKAGVYDLTSALTLDEVEEFVAQGRMEEKLIKVDTVFQELQEVILNDTETIRYLNGAFIKINHEKYQRDEQVRVYCADHSFLGLGKVLQQEGVLRLKSEKLFMER